MNASNLTIASIAAAVTVLCLMTGAPLVFAERALPGLTVGQQSLSGISYQELPNVLGGYEAQLLDYPVTLTVEEAEAELSLRQLGFRLDSDQLASDIKKMSRQPLWRLHRVPLQFVVDQTVLRQQVEAAFAQHMNPPQNATLVEQNGQLLLKRGARGQGVDTAALSQSITADVRRELRQPIAVQVIDAAPAVEDTEIEAARTLATQLLRDGVTLQFEDQTITIKPFTIRRLLTFVEQPDPTQPANSILGVQFKTEELADYLATTVAPAIDRAPVNARFVRAEAGAITQFTEAQRGFALEIEATVTRVNAKLAAGETIVPLAVAIAEPTITGAADLQDLGVTALLARGESDYAGSPRNRTHNIAVGAEKYHGLLIPPGAEFSFNEFLGPVTAAAGFKPELVIKENVTTPEYGGGLCQVSTTAFRAAIYSGLPITMRRNHSYAVSYYGTPGFDATIYPPYTDLRFLNDTPGYILIQTTIEGTKLIFEFWGTDDGREVEVAGPTPYNRQPDGAVKATLTQKVVRDGATLLEDTFYSNYKSPNLFPKVVAANGEGSPSAAPALETTDQDNADAKPTPNPTPAATPQPAGSPAPS